MLHNTFIHLPGVGEKTEKRIWRSGIRSWDEWREPFPAGLPQSKIKLISQQLAAFRALDDGSARFYAEHLPAGQLWRLFPHFRNRTAYLDIETNGLGWGQMEITAIALYDGQQARSYVQGENLEQFTNDIGRYEMIVTYNGKGFDVPVIESCLRIRLPQVHLDLRHILARLGFRGGLKGCEKQLGVSRPGLDGVDGYWAVLLWQEFERSGSREALETLLAYNIADAVNLEPLLVHAYNLNIADTPFSASHYIPLPELPAPLFLPDQKIIRKISERLQSSFLGWG